MKKSIIILLIVSTVLLIQINNQIAYTYATDDLDNGTSEYLQIKHATQKISYTPHPNGSVHITSNADFSNYGFTGTGSYDSPYTLYGYSIKNSTVEPIYIQGTTDYFVITSCLLDSDDWSHDVISLTNVANGLIEYCTIKNGNDGIKLSSNSTEIVINDNTIINNSNMGIGHYNSEHNYITNNDISLSGCNSSTVGIGASIERDSSVQQTGGQGVYLDPSKNVAICGNSIHHNEHDGIHVVDSTFITISNNSIYNNGASECPVSPTIKGPISYKIQQTGGQGVYLDPSHNITIHQNVISNNSEYGVWIQEGKNNTITFNDFIDNNGGNKQANDNNTDTTYNNSFSNNYWSDHNGSSPYYLDGDANNADYSPKASTITITLTCTYTRTPPSTGGSEAAGFSFNVIMLVLLTITLIVRKNPRFRRKK